MTQKILVLLSGGIDSTTVLYDCLQKSCKIEAVSFNYGAKHNRQELTCAEYHTQKHSIRHHIIPLDFINEFFTSDLLLSGNDVPDGHYEESSMKKTVVPFRNGIMLSIAAGLAESVQASELVIAAHSGDHAIYPDCRESFMAPMANAISKGTYAEIILTRPFIDMKKSEIVALGTSLQVDYSHTWSCYKGREIHCGSCGTCVERREAFMVAGLTDPTKYKSTDVLPPKP